MAWLAAADRSAEREANLETSASVEHGCRRVPAGSDSVDIAATAAVAAGVPRRRPRRWSSSDPSPVAAGGERRGHGRRATSPPIRSGRTGARWQRAHFAPPPGGGAIGIRVGTGIAVAVIALLAFKLERSPPWSCA